MLSSYIILLKTQGRYNIVTIRHYLKKYKNKLDCLFNTLLLLKLSLILRDKRGNLRTVTVFINRYHNKDGIYFTAEYLVRLINKIKAEVSTLKKGIKVWTLKGGRGVKAILAISVKDKKIYRIKNLVITSQHPIYLNKKWVFPDRVAESKV